MMYAIEDGIPVPNRICGQPKHEATLTFEALAIGQSFVVNSEHNSLRSSIWHAAKTRGWKASIRKLDGGTIRVWRVA